MCTYTRTVFECKHHLWGRRLKLCTIGEDFRAGELPSDCAFRKPHGLHSRRIPRRCDKCRALDCKVALVRAKLEDCQAAFRERWPAYGAGGAKGEGTSEGAELERVDGESWEALDVDWAGEEAKGSEQTKELTGTTLNSSPRGVMGWQQTRHSQGLATIQEM
ncbi:hypothetical protein TOPH_05192 [Tolypocladium ophioglossoides CBS 100239]|uniref:Uncharacterized protein n=1 Tax=Tolypocladium ophioglossoides (strain CBS 100239) TaxID=1163406 RepID=A0A0L0N8I5_TOLOC|nr:hypothetical protein TOPH_05192 [Tolypocladium ophioglossoides CBS 100239]